MIEITSLNLTLAIFAVFGVVFSIFSYFKNPQIQTDLATSKLAQDVEKLQQDMSKVQKDIVDIRETHLRALELELKQLTVASAKLATIIDERIPRATPNLTPPGR